MVHQSLNLCPDTQCNHLLDCFKVSHCLKLMASRGHLRRDSWVNKAALNVPCPINILQESFVTTATPECLCPHGPIDQFCAVNSTELSITSPRDETALSVASWFPPASHQPRGCRISRTKSDKSRFDPSMVET